MFIVGIFSWWYAAGWKSQVHRLRARLVSLMDYFSIELLLKTLFSPFRQISAGRINGPIGVQMRALADQLISRCIGAMVRSAIILVGIIAIIGYLLISACLLIVWPLLPFAPIAGLVLSAIGLMPWSR